MQSPLNRYLLLAKRWLWMIILGAVICGGASYVISKLTHPVYQASATLVVNLDKSSPNNNAQASILAVPTYAQLLTNPVVLNPILALHSGMTIDQLTAMMTVVPQANTQLIVLNIQNGNPQLAMELANEVSQGFAQYSNMQLPGSIQVWSAQLPVDPIKPKPLQDAGLGALVGLGLAIALIFIFEWIGDRLSNPEDLRELLDMEVLAIIPQFLNNKHNKASKNILPVIEKYRILGASLNNVKLTNPFKLVMVTSAMAGEGKSTVAANLASYLSMTGKYVLLVDANLRQPVQAQRFQLDNQRGLSNVFMEMWTMPRMELFGQETDIPTLRVLTSGPILSRTAELLQSPLASQLFEYFRNAPFDYIIFDSPPLLPIADAQIIASLVQAIVLVVDANKTPRRMLLRARRMLNRVHATKLGVTINKSRWLDEGDREPYSGKGQQPQNDSIMIMHPDLSIALPPGRSIAFQAIPNTPNTPFQAIPNTPNTPFQALKSIPPVKQPPRALIRPPIFGDGSVNHNNNSIPYYQQEANSWDTGKGQN